VKHTEAKPFVAAGVSRSCLRLANTAFPSGALAGAPIFDYALVNKGTILATLRARYAAKGAERTITYIECIEHMGIRCVTGDFVDGNGLLRHAFDSVTETLLALVASAPRSVGSALEAHCIFPEFGRALSAETAHGAQ